MKASENDYEEPEDARLREQLGLRPIHYVASLGGEPHPDTDECPAWCWVAQQEPGGDAYTHEVEPDDPMRATHTLEPCPTIVASLYRGDYSRDAERRLTTPATVSVYARAKGTRPPVISLSLLRPSHPVRAKQHTELLSLTAADARELITALTYVLEQVDPVVASDSVPHVQAVN